MTRKPETTATLRGARVALWAFGLAWALSAPTGLASPETPAPDSDVASDEPAQPRRGKRWQRRESRTDEQRASRRARRQTFRSAGDLTGAGRLQQAVKLYREELEQQPNNPKLRLALGVTLAHQGACVAAEAELIQAETTRSWNEEGEVARALCALDDGLPENALEHANRALELEPLQLEALEVRFEALVKLGRAAEAREDLGLLFHYGSSTKALAFEVYSYWGSPDFDARLEELRLALDGSNVPGAGYYWFLDALSAQRAGDIDVAEHSAMMAVKYQLRDQSWTALRAESLRRTGQPYAAAEALDRVLIRRADFNFERQAIQVRVLVDQGEESAASAVAQQLPHPDSLLCLQSRWYLAHTVGDSVTADALSKRYSTRYPDADPLERLIPR